MKRKHLIPILLMVVLAGSGQFATGQNLYVEITDAATYRPLSNTRVELKSEQSMIVFISSPRGEVLENVPAGFYTISISRPTYETKVLHDVEIQRNEITTLSVSLRTGTADTPAGDLQETIKEETKVEVEKPVLTEIPVKKGFIDFSYQTGNIQSFQAGFGWFIFQELYAKIAYAYSRQTYASIYFKNSKEYQLQFNNLSAALGYEYIHPLKELFGVFINPEIYFGMEFLNSKSVIGQKNISFIMNSYLRPGVSAGIYYNKLSLFGGLNFSQWVSQPMTQERYGLYDVDSNQPLSWKDDLFPGRKGVGLFIGARYGFN